MEAVGVGVWRLGCAIGGSIKVAMQVQNTTLTAFVGFNYFSTLHIVGGNISVEFGVSNLVSIALMKRGFSTSP